MKKRNEVTTTYEDYFDVAPGVWGMRIVFANIYMIATQNKEWVLVDAGLNGFAGRIERMAADLFGENNPPAAIILTHGHFDHVGALKKLLEKWDVPVYAHPLEIPYLIGQSAYPPPDPTVGGGMMSTLSVLYPKKPIDIGDKAFILNENGSLPHLPEWNYIHTPGHAPGHISLFRNRDKVLIAGDAFVTTQQESAFSVAKQKKLVSGPPKYFTVDWKAAAESVKKLRDLHPAIAATGHGKPMSGQELRDGLDYLVSHFKEVAVPEQGRYVKESAKTNRRGVLYVPPRPFSPVLAASAAGLVALGLYTLVKSYQKKK
ncbi:MBL fold metallo-hydrolase [Mucilaginibacter sp. Bleaf8]|uniref:MBL fold metallo-hydrolase n=1 Tax=Mucilaginibacter sp. Bleaf8 TaxID=2834430 RepID=UPI001BCB4810|nr:MBL fold metallo-hydrolase [Mucilaginibacter sp. Bleaf8]MBS7565260.1 MBL fold metallo-hydrolase [Mucilaginibacter sp. Bleaf8]